MLVVLDKFQFWDNKWEHNFPFQMDLHCLSATVIRLIHTFNHPICSILFRKLAKILKGCNVNLQLQISFKFKERLFMRSRRMFLWLIICDRLIHI